MAAVAARTAAAPRRRAGAHAARPRRCAGAPRTAPRHCTRAEPGHVAADAANKADCGMCSSGRPPWHAQVLAAAAAALLSCSAADAATFPSGFPVDERPAVAEVQRSLVEAWTLTREQFYDADALAAVQWDGQLQAALQATHDAADASEARGVVTALLSRLADPYTRLISEQDYSSFTVHNDGKLTGVGLLLAADPNTGRLVILRPLDSSPASRAGVEPGDELLGIDGSPVQRGTSTDAVAARLRGVRGSSVQLRVRHTETVPGTASRPPFSRVRNVRLNREEIDLSPVTSQKLPFVTPDGALHNAGYLRLATFSANASRDVDAALAELRAAGADGGLILDLRGNPGGLVTAGLEVARTFLTPGDIIVSTLDRSGEESIIGLAPSAGGDEPAAAGDELAAARAPLVVLIDNGSASAAEIVAGALHDHGYALLGTNSYGKGKIQRAFPLSDGGALFVTVATYRTPNGAAIDRIGIKPDAMCAAVDATPLAEDACVIEAEARLAQLAAHPAA